MGGLWERKMSALTLKVLTPAGGFDAIPCDSVTIVVRDNAKGEGGGSMGIRKGHIEAVAMLEANSSVKARSDGAEVAVFTVSGGFAGVKSDTVTVVAESAVRV